MPPRRDRTEAFTSAGLPIGAQLEDFWAWTSSDLLGNALRGTLAEFIVGTALDCIGPDDTRLEWDARDLVTRNGVSIEVKSTAYLQSWGQTQTASMKFGVAKTRAWNALTNEYSDEYKRQADVYIFCVLTSTDRDTADPLNTDQWHFYVASTRYLNGVLGEQKSVSLSVLMKLDGVAEATYTELPTVFRSVWDTDQRQSLTTD